MDCFIAFSMHQSVLSPAQHAVLLTAGSRERAERAAFGGCEGGDRQNVLARSSHVRATA